MQEGAGGVKTEGVDARGVGGSEVEGASRILHSSCLEVLDSLGSIQLIATQRNSTQLNSARTTVTTGLRTAAISGAISELSSLRHLGIHASAKQIFRGYSMESLSPQKHNDPPFQSGIRMKRGLLRCNSKASCDGDSSHCEFFKQILPGATLHENLRLI